MKTFRNFRKILIAVMMAFALIIVFQNCSLGSFQTVSLVSAVTSSSTIPTSVLPSPAIVAATPYGTYLKPFSADSLWNSRPINPVLDSNPIPQTSYLPVIAAGDLSVETFLASAADEPMQVYGNDNGVYNAEGPVDPDKGVRAVVQIPHWPSQTFGASGGDGHADIYDPTTGIIHSFWQLKQLNGSWTASLYAWTRIDGTGWGDPNHYYQGARAAGVVPSAGVIRRGEAFDGATMYSHVLAMSMDSSALKSGYVFPATSEDGYGPYSYSGQIPMGSLIMLPPDFDTSKITTPEIKKVAETLKVYGARLVDTNTQTRFAVYVEIGTNYDIYHGNGISQPGADEIRLVADALRMVNSTSGFIDGNGKSFIPNQNMNLVSMRGPWFLSSGNESGDFDSWGQTFRFPVTTAYTREVQSNVTFAHRTNWAPWVSGKTYEFKVTATGGAKLNLQFKTTGFTTAFETSDLGDGESVRFTMPDDTGYPLYIATTGAGPGSSVSATLIRVDP